MPSGDPSRGNSAPQSASNIRREMVKSASQGKSDTIRDTSISGADADIFRDTPLRYLGYANELGEAFRPIYPRIVVPSYGVAFAYVGADSVLKTWNAYQKGSSHTVAVATFTDCLTWQTLASVLIPGKVIHAVTGMSSSLLKSSQNPTIRKFGATAIGLAFIPLIIKPIDAGVDLLMDSTLRKVLPKDHGGQ